MIKSVLFYFAEFWKLSKLLANLYRFDVCHNLEQYR